jgi:polysaccharide pyruvyl transferase WcaK-like protein
MNKYVAILDTAISSLNVGNDIIMEGVMDQIQDVFPDYQYIHIPANEKIRLSSLPILRKSTVCIQGGTNALSSNVQADFGFIFSTIDAYFIKHKVTLLGVGWAKYENKPNRYSKSYWKRVLSDVNIHSVRDAYTERNLKEIGISNVVNTGCPTMWKLTRDHCSGIPQSKAEKVIFTLTDYSKNPIQDRKMIEALQKHYEEIFFWVQGIKDLEYLNSFGDLIHGIKIVPPNLRAYNAILDKANLDYVGTRLHAGIRALQKKIRTIIIGIDNRAEEKRKSYNLPVVDRSNIDQLGEVINNKLELNISLPTQNIQLWKSQFNHENSQNN